MSDITASSVVMFCLVLLFCVMVLYVIVLFVMMFRQEFRATIKPPVSQVPHMKQPQHIETTAQKLATVRARLETDTRLEAELLQQLEREQGAEGGYRGVSAEVRASRDSDAEARRDGEAEREAQAEAEASGSTTGPNVSIV